MFGDNDTLSYGVGMGEALYQRRVEILRYLARRAGPMGPAESA
jgi:hypothetical protein